MYKQKSKSYFYYKQTGGMSMKQKAKSSIVSLIVFIVITALIITGMVGYHFSKRTVWNIGNVTGNTAGNLYNNGLFCEYNNKIYFSNSYDEGKLYVMDSNGTNIQKLYDDSVSYINAAGKYIFYARNNLSDETVKSVFRGNLFGVYRINTNGKGLVQLNNEPCGVVSLGNNKIFYQHYEAETALSLRSVSIDGSKEIEIDSTAINPSCIADGTIYYNNVSDNFNLCTLDVESEQTMTIVEDSFWHPIVQDGFVYFMDIKNNYSLARMNLFTKEKEDLKTGRVDTFNVYGDYIFYQTNSAEEPQFCRMKTDGTDATSIITGNFCNINVTSNYVFFNQFGNDTPIYKVATTGDMNVTRFDEADEAIKK